MTHESIISPFDRRLWPPDILEAAAKIAYDTAQEFGDSLCIGVYAHTISKSLNQWSRVETWRREHGVRS